MKARQAAHNEADEAGSGSDSEAGPSKPGALRGSAGAQPDRAAATEHHDGAGTSAAADGATTSAAVPAPDAAAGAAADDDAHLDDVLHNAFAEFRGGKRGANRTASIARTRARK